MSIASPILNCDYKGSTKALLELKSFQLGFYEGHYLFQPINLSLRAGDCIQIVGRNGSGKSSLLRYLAGQRQNLFTHGLHEQIGEFAYLPQQLPADSPLHLKASDLFALYDCERLPWICDDTLNTSWNFLSGGQRQKVWINIQISSKKPLLILDEPFHSLDSSSRQELFDILKEELQNNRAIILSHHDSDFETKFTRLKLEAVAGSA